MPFKDREYYLQAQRDYSKKRYADPDRAIERMCKRARDRARTAGLPFDLTPEYVREIWPTDNRCPILGIELVPCTPSSGHRGPHTASPSLERRKPELGYVRGNIAVISHKANAMKMDCIDPAVFRRLADWVEGT